MQRPKLHTCMHNEAWRVTFLNTPEIKEMFAAESRPDKSLALCVSHKKS